MFLAKKRGGKKFQLPGDHVSCILNIFRRIEEGSMSYKTILVHVDESPHSDLRIEFAARIAQTHNAHLLGVAVAGVHSGCDDIDDPDSARRMAGLRQAPIDALKQFEAIARQVGVASFEKRLIDEDAEGGISLLTRYCDLVVLSQRDSHDQSPAASAGFPECVIHNAACPTLIVPSKALPDSTGARMLIAWNGSMESTRAVHSGIPLLQQAKTVEIAALDPGMHCKPLGEQPGVEIARYLARHGVEADIIKQPSRGDVGDALLSLAANLGSDMLVAGFFGRWHFGEIVLGGVTNTVLGSSTVPVLMSR
jgi:nucleotide-binding universal stress UspA family protein